MKSLHDRAFDMLAGIHGECQAHGFYTLRNDTSSMTALTDLLLEEQNRQPANLTPEFLAQLEMMP